MKLWDFKKTHAKAWKVDADHYIELQLDRWEEAPLMGLNFIRRKQDQDHPGIRFTLNILRWELAIEYYSVHHAPGSQMESLQEKGSSQ